MLAVHRASRAPVEGGGLMAVTKRVRFEVLRRDNHTCRYCHATDSPLTIDHVLPVALGGADTPDNLVAACKDCNAGKAATSPEAPLATQVSNDAVRWAEAMSDAWRGMQGDRKAASEQLQPFYDTWSLHARTGWSSRLPANAEDVLLQYVAAGMPVEVLCEAALVALRRSSVDDRFRYFRGVANNMLRELQETARSLAAVPVVASAVDERCSHSTPMLEDNWECSCWVIGWGVGEDVMVDWFQRDARRAASLMQMRALSAVVDGRDVWLPTGQVGA